jgi:hypothetical protein
MNSLALEYCILGRHADALVLQEKVLEVRRRILPVDHNDIGEVHTCAFLTIIATCDVCALQTRPCTILQKHTPPLRGTRRHVY